MKRSSSEMKGYAIVVRGVKKSYGNFRVLNDVSFTVNENERIVICGPSGSGKSTFVRCVNGLEHIDGGEILVHGERIDSRSRQVHLSRRKIGMVFQQFNLFPHLTVLENCTMAPVLNGLCDKQTARETALGFLGRTRMLDQASKYPADLSGGQQQRAAIARALCLRPRVMLFDEPTSALDPEMVKEVLDTMIELTNDGMAMICVTHEMGFARRVADRVVFMDEGAIVRDVPTDQFFDRNDSERVQRFLSQIAH